MQIDFSKMIPVAEALGRAALPSLATIAGEAVPPPFNLIAGPIFHEIAAKMGVDSAASDAPEQVANAIDANPQAASAILQPLNDNSAALAAEITKQRAIEAGDTANARQMQISLAQMNNPLAYGAAIFTAAVFVACVLLIVLAAIYPQAQALFTDWNGTMRQLLTLAAGYWLGSSQGSHAKTQQLAAAMAQAQAQAPTLIAQSGSKVTSGVIK